MPVATARCSLQLAAVIQACWHKDASLRPSMSRVARELRALESSAPDLAAFEQFDMQCLGPAAYYKHKQNRGKAGDAELLAAHEPCCAIS